MPSSPRDIQALPCREVVRLASRSLDDILPESSRAALDSHCSWCVPCRICREQFGLLRHWLREPHPGGAAAATTKLPQAVAQRLKRTLAAHDHDPDGN